MNTTWKILSCILMLLVVGILFLPSTQTVTPANAQELTFTVSEPVTPHLSVAVRDLPDMPRMARLDREINPLRNPHYLSPDLGLEGTDTKGIDPLWQQSLVNTGNTPDPILNFEGLGSDGNTPPDTVGDVGPNHYVQMVNISFQIYDKSGTVLRADTPFNALFAGAGGVCEARNDGDPIVVYDDMADRWLLSQFADIFGSMTMCIAISETSDPLGAYYLYEFNGLPDVPDYFKFGAWPDGYYMSTNSGSPNAYYAHVFEREQMLTGAAATLQSFGGFPNFMMPADADGDLPPPADSPNPFYTFFAEGYPDHPAGVDRLALYEFDVDWGNPANSSFGLAQEIPIADYNYTVCGFFVGDCIPQPGTAQGLDSLSYWPMWRFQYRNFGAYEAAVGNFTVDLDGNDKAAIRWFELRKAGADWELHQEGTHAPDDDHRWMGSIAQDGSGNIALGYSVASATTFPSIRYATRLRSDPVGTLQQEATLIDGGGSQTTVHRWGDYSAMTVDPVDNCTFWYTTEYHPTDDQGFNWHTRIGSFRLPECTGTVGPTGVLEGTVTDNSDSNPIEGAIIQATGTLTQTGSTTTDENGHYQMTLSEYPDYDVTASAYGYQPATVTSVSVVSDLTTTLDMALEATDFYLVEGTITDLNTGWPLYASISIEGDPLNPPDTEVWSDPVTGYYSMTLAADIGYTFSVSAWVDGYTPVSVDMAPLTSNTTVDVALDVDLVACTAPGYEHTYAFFDDFESGDANWTMTGLWNAENEADACGSLVAPFPSPSNAAYYGQDGICTYETGTQTSGFLTLVDPISIPATGGALYFDSYEETQCFTSCAFDTREIQASTDGGSTWETVGETDTVWVWYQSSFDLSPYANHDLHLRFAFDSINDFRNDFFGWMIDDVKVATGCVPTAGGLVVGNTVEAPAGEPLTDVQVVNESGEMTISMATPDDPMVDDGFYTLFSPAGTHAFTATFTADYAPDVENVNVLLNDTVRQDFILEGSTLTYSPDEIEEALEMGDVVTTTVTLSASGPLDVDFSLYISSFEAPTLALPTTVDGEGQWLYREHPAYGSEEKEAVAGNSRDGSMMAEPKAYRWQPTVSNGMNVLLYADDVIHTAPETYPDQALQALGIAYTAHYGGDWEGFENNLTSGTWDMVLVAADNVPSPESTLTALEHYVTNGGKLVYHSRAVGQYPNHALWTTLGFSWVNDSSSADSVYWWESGHPLFMAPEIVPEFTALDAGLLFIDGQHVEPLTGFTALAGYTTPGPDPNQAALIIGNDNRTIFKAFLDGHNSADLDSDSIPDALELWINMISGLQSEFSSQWATVVPDSGTIAADGTTTIDVVFDTRSLYQVGDYSAEMSFHGSFVNDLPTMPLTMHVTCPACGFIDGAITDLDTGAPVNAQIHITDTNGVDILLTGDSYHAAVQPGTYNISVVANGYFDESATVTVTAGASTMTNFVLTPMIAKLEYTPASISETIEFGDMVNNTVTVFNPGYIDLEFDVQIGGYEEPVVNVSPALEAPLHNSSSQALASCPIVNRDFETGDFTGWTTVNGGGTWLINDGSYTRNADGATTPPVAGQFSAFVDQLSPGPNMLYQDIVLPAVLPNSLVISWMDQWENHAAEFNDSQEFRVELYAPGGTLLLGELFSTQAGDPLLSEPTTRFADITALVAPYAGESVRLQFVEEDSLNYFNVQVDDVFCGSQWASATPSSGVIPAGESMTFEVLFDASEIYQEGQHSAELSFSGNFANDVPTMPLTMDASCASCGLLDGAITDAWTGEPVEAELYVTGTDGFDITLRGDSYEITVQPGSYEFTVRANDYLEQSATVIATANSTITTDFALVPMVALLEYDSDTLDIDLELGASTMHSLTLSNVGTIDMSFEIRELNGDVPPELTAVQVPGYQPTDSATANSYAHDKLVERESWLYTPREDALWAHHLAAGPNVLLVAAAEMSQLQAILQAYPDLGAIDYFNARLTTPTLAELQAYDVVIVTSGFYFADPVAMGDLLADYLDNGGKLIQSAPTFYDANGFGSSLQGRYVDEGYSPFIGTGDWFLSANLGDFDASHPIMAGVTEASDLLRQVMELSPDAELVAEWTDDEFIATKGSVVALNTWLSDGFMWTGDIDLIVHNSIIWLWTGGDVPWLSENPASGIIAAGETMTIDLIFDTSALSELGTYTAELNFHGNFENDVANIPITMQVGSPTAISLTSMSAAKSTQTPLLPALLMTLIGIFGVVMVIRKRSV